MTCRKLISAIKKAIVNGVDVPRMIVLPSYTMFLSFPHKKEAMMSGAIIVILTKEKILAMVPSGIKRVFDCKDKKRLMVIEESANRKEFEELRERILRLIDERNGVTK